MEIQYVMSIILGSLVLTIYLLTLIQTKAGTGNYLPSITTSYKRDFEIYALKYTVIWIFIFGIVIIFKLWKIFEAMHYMILCVSLSLPLLLQPILYPLPSEKKLTLFERYSFKANLWIAIFSFIGNYWYTHYFYHVLGAQYLFPAHRLNDVPIALYFATHFYFITYHTFSNLILRKVETTYKKSINRTILFWFTVFAFSYFTAFMETLTISSFEYYSFTEDKNQVYKVGSAFYGLYFIVSFPLFYNLDKDVNSDTGKAVTQKNLQKFSIFQVIIEVLGASMAVLMLLDIFRLILNRKLIISGILYELKTKFN